MDLGHHAPNVNIEQIVARLHALGKLGGFHFNDSKYGDDDLDSGAINPHQLFLVFNELVRSRTQFRAAGFEPAYMIDQSHNVTDPIESMLSSAEAIVGAFAQGARFVDRDALRAAPRTANDVMMAFQAASTGLQDGREPDPRHGAQEAGRRHRRPLPLPRQRLAQRKAQE